MLSSGDRLKPREGDRPLAPTHATPRAIGGWNAASEGLSESSPDTGISIRRRNSAQESIQRLGAIIASPMLNKTVFLM